MKPHHSLILLLLLFPAACSAPQKENITFKNTVVSLTFDDGNADNYIVRPALAENNLHATFYIVSGFTDTNGFMTENQLRDLYNDGNEIGGHTLSHVNLPDVRGADLEREICDDRNNLLARGFDAMSFAYPYGHFDDVARQAVIDCGYSNARGVSGGPDTIPPADAHDLKAMPYIVGDTRLPKMLRYVTEVEDAGGGWVIFVFHHVCDGCNEYAIKPETFSQFAQWLGEQQANGLIVQTVGDVISGRQP
ncbi:MAG: polysaccharide deacetylase family protein [Chloroflexi bacterium]|nr:polysaccharide deacetylase family protein [Chloroflexota bacterium]